MSAHTAIFMPQHKPVASVPFMISAFHFKNLELLFLNFMLLFALRHCAASLKKGKNDVTLLQPLKFLFTLQRNHCVLSMVSGRRKKKGNFL